MLGRVSSVNAIFIGSSNELGYFESGVAARLLGPVPSALFGGTMTLLTVAIIAWLVPDVRRLGVIQRDEASHLQRRVVSVLQFIAQFSHLPSPISRPILVSHRFASAGGRDVVVAAACDHHRVPS